MHPAKPEQRIAELEQKVEDLEFELKYWHDLARPPPYAEIARLRELGIQPHQVGLVRLLDRRGAVGREMVIACLGEDTTYNYTTVVIFHLRRVLKKHDIHIETIWGWGYKVREADRERLKELLAGAAE